MGDRIAWSAKVSDTFLDRAKWIVDDLEIGEHTKDGLDKLMTCIAWESGRTFSASVTNMAGSGATGLIQFMPSTAKSLGTTTAKLAKMTPEDQLNYVWKYFASYKGKLKTLADLYMAILWPKAVGKPETYVLWEKGSKPTTYRQNAGLDANKDGAIIKAEAAAKVTALLVEGLSPKNTREYGVDSLNYVVEPEPAGEVTVPTVVVSAPVEAATSVTETADTVTTVTVEPKTTVTAVKNAAGGWQGTLTGIVAIVGALLLDPSFSAALGRFTTSLATGNGRWGAFVALLGAGLVIYRARSTVK